MGSILTAALGLLLSAGEPPLPLEGRDLDAAIDRAIDSGVEYLLKAVQGPRGFCPEEKYPSGYAALQVYALAKCGVSSRHPLIQKGLAVLQESKFEKVYSVSLDVMAHDAFLEEIDAAAREGEGRPGADREKFLNRMEAGTAWLIASRLRTMGAWNYGPLPPKGNPRTARWDNSNTQFAVLALGVAAERKLKVPREIWEEIAEHFLKEQERDGKEVEGRPEFRDSPGGKEEKGKTAARKTHPLYAGEKVQVRARGWFYEKETGNRMKGRGRTATFSMTCAGLSSLLLAERNLPASWIEGPGGQGLRSALRDGYGWIADLLQRRARSVKAHYAFYSLEKVGDLGGIAAFGGFRWYEELARKLLSSQEKDGSWGDPKEEAKLRSETSLALLFLSRATDFRARSGPLVQVTRSGGEEGRPGSRAPGGWIYIPSLKGDVSLTRLFRLLRYRPGKQVFKLLEEAVGAEDPEKIDRLAEPLAAALERSPFDETKACALKLLERITGLEGRGPAAYREWASRWREVLGIGKSKDPKGVEKLRSLLRASEGKPIRLKAMWALERTMARAALGDLVGLLEDRDPEIREAAHGALTFISSNSLPFTPRGSEAQRAGEVLRWREWLVSDGSR